MAVSGLSQTHEREHQGARARPSELPLVPPLHGPACYGHSVPVPPLYRVHGACNLSLKLRGV